jgi:hypothetical protein
LSSFIGFRRDPAEAGGLRSRLRKKATLNDPKPDSTPSLRHEPSGGFGCFSSATGMEVYRFGAMVI